MHDCFTELPVSLAPRDVCSRLNTFMLETQRRLQHGDKNALNMHLVSLENRVNEFCWKVAD